MRRIQGKIWAVILAAVLIVGGLYYLEIIQESRGREPAVYSVILYQNMDNEWESLVDGINQAEDDLDVTVRYVYLKEGATAEDQAEMIEREVSAGASGILLAAVDSEELGKYIKDKNVLVPVVAVETGLGEYSGELESYISADNYAMGQLLGEKILKDMEEETDFRFRVVTVVAEYLERESVAERYRGLRETLEKASEEVQIQEISRQEGDFSLQLFIQTELVNSGDYIAALDKFSTREAAAAVPSAADLYRSVEEDGQYLEKKRTLKIYGIGNTAQTVNALDSGSLEALVFQNEFNMGYEGLQALVDKEEKGYVKSGIEIMHKLVTREEMYEPENERILFPGA